MPRQLPNKNGSKAYVINLLSVFTMISKAKVKYIKSLQVKKYRKQEQCFVVEGSKSINELLRSDFEVIWVGATKTFITRHEQQLSERAVEVSEATEMELSSLGAFQTNDAAIAIARMKPNVSLQVAGNEVVLILDDIRDPGNLGTIIRTADWFGVHKIIATAETADVYNSKVISASMGSFCRVQIFYTDLSAYLSSYKKSVYGTFLDGVDVHSVNFSEGGLIVIGNEANGISKPVEELVTTRITIPRYGAAESLNAGIATGIVLDCMARSKK